MKMLLYRNLQKNTEQNQYVQLKLLIVLLKLLTQIQRKEEKVIKIKTLVHYFNPL